MRRFHAVAIVAIQLVVVDEQIEVAVVIVIDPARAGILCRAAVGDNRIALIRDSGKGLRKYYLRQ